MNLGRDAVVTSDGIPRDDAPDEGIGNHCSRSALTSHVHEFAVDGLGKFHSGEVLVFFKYLGEDILKSRCVNKVFGRFL